MSKEKAGGGMSEGETDHLKIPVIRDSLAGKLLKMAWQELQSFGLGICVFIADL